MRAIDCEQGSREWIEARLGIPTASQFGRIITAKRMELSSQRHAYAAELLCEWWCGEPKEDLSDNIWVQRGKALEPEARDFYAVATDREVAPVGLCLRDIEAQPGGLTVDGVAVQPIMEPIAGASPDGLVGDDGLLELKCPAPDTHLLWLARGTLPSQHVAQVQGQLWVTGRAWADFMSYCPELPPLLIRVEPDEKMQAAFDDALPLFHAELEAGRQRLIDMGVKPWRGEPCESSNPTA